jgi:hypothetical protein
LATFQHPATLNPFKQFMQGWKILKHTSRATNPAWYRAALELPYQLHIRVDGASILTFYYDQKQSLWSPGPKLKDGSLHDPGQLEEIAAEALRFVRTQGGSALGLILHIADEFATTDIKPELNSTAELTDLRQTAITDPESILEDSSIQADQSAWRVLPYPAATGDRIGTTVTVSRQYAPLIALFREVGENENFPIITLALSAPIVAIMGLGQILKPTPGRPFVAILQYSWFTVLAFFNDQADLRLTRTLQHRGLRRPTNFRNALSTTNASLEFVDPDLFLVPLGGNVDASLDEDLRMTFSASRVEVIDPITTNEIPAWSPEFINATQAPNNSDSIQSHTFSVLRDEKWALQNYLPIPQEISEVFPSQKEIQLLRFIKKSRYALAGAAVLCVGTLSFSVFEITKKPEWAFDENQSKTAQAMMTKLTQEKQRGEFWSNLLEDRSKAWTSMESLARMFPENSGILVKTYSHTATPEAASAVPKGALNSKAGFSKEWKITGFARDEAIEYLNSLNTKEGITDHFAGVAKITGNSSYIPNLGNRGLTINVRTQENSSYKPNPAATPNNSDTTSYSLTFDLTINQRFEASDPLALNTTKAP